MTAASVMTDHPSWTVTDEGVAYRAVRCGASVWVLTAVPTGDGYDLTACGSDRRGGAPRPVLDVVDPASLSGDDVITERLQAAGSVGRWRNPDLWDALATAIVRQVIRAGQARKLYRRMCHAHGDHILTPHGATAVFPTPAVILDLPDSEFSDLGLAFKRRPLRAAAQAVLDLGDKWAELEPADLLTEVQNVPRIGPWTAGAAVADMTNDFSLYPFADLAVRTWAAKLAPEHAWPEAEPDFARAWQQSAHDELSAQTLLTLAWGVRHANATGDTAL